MANSVRLYTIAFEKDGKPIKNISVLDFFQRLNNYLENNHKIRNILNKVITCSKFYFDNNNSKRIIIPFGKLKEGLSYTVNDESIFEEIDTDIFNINSLEYDEEEKILAFTTSGDGPNINHIEGYLNSFLPEERDFVIKIHPIFKNKDLNTIRRAKYIRRVEFILDMSQPSTTLYNHNLGENEDNLLKKLINLYNGFKEDLSPKSFSFSIGVGRAGKDSSLEFDNMIYLLEQIDLNAEIVKEIIVHYKNNTQESVEWSKLKNSNVIVEHDFKINAKNISPEYLRDNWKQILNEERIYFRREIENYYRGQIRVDIVEYEFRQTE